MSNSSPKKILFIGNKSWAAYNFRHNLIIDLIKLGYDVSIVCSDDEKRPEFEKLGVHFSVVNFDNRSVNIFSFGGLVKRFRKEIRKVDPDIVFNFQLKANIFGSRAAYKENKKYVCLNEGLGDGFGSKNSLIGRITGFFSIRYHRKSLKHAYRVFVINHDDMSFFLKKKICPQSKLILLHGIGVDCSKYNVEPLPETFSVLNISRLVKTKGVFDYCEIARQTRKIDNDIVFKLVGPVGDISEKDIASYIKNKDIVYYGRVDDVKPYIKDSSVILLPSFREGFPISLVEAGAMGRLSLAYDVPGPRSLIENGVNGFLVRFKNYDDLINKIIALKNHRGLLSYMGENASKVVRADCDVRVINTKIIEVIDACINQ